MQTTAGLHLFRATRSEPLEDLSNLPYNHDLMRVTADPDISLDDMSEAVHTLLPTELAKSIIFDPRFQESRFSNLRVMTWYELAVKHREAYGWLGPLVVPKSVSMNRVRLMPRAQHGRYEESEWYGSAFHEFASERFLWLEHGMMPLDTGSPLLVKQPYGLIPTDKAGQYYLGGGYLIEEHPRRGVVVWPRKYGTTMPAAQSGATYSIPGTAAGTFRTPPRLEVFAENGRLPLITKQMLRMILGTLEPGVAPQLKLHADTPPTQADPSGQSDPLPRSGPAIPSVDVPELPTVPMTALVPVRVSQSSSGVTHVWVGIPPDAGLAEKIRVAAGTVVVHAHGTNGAMAADSAKLGEVIAASKATQVLLLVCEQTQAQQFANRHNIATWATKDALFVNKADGSVFIGQGQVDAAGRLTIADTDMRTLNKYLPSGIDRVARPGPSPLIALTRSQAQDPHRRNDWQKRGWNATTGFAMVGAETPHPDLRGVSDPAPLSRTAKGLTTLLAGPSAVVPSELRAEFDVELTASGPTIGQILRRDGAGNWVALTAAAEPSWLPAWRQADADGAIGRLADYKWKPTAAGLHLFRAGRTEPLEDLSNLPYNHHLMRVTADHDISLNLMSALVRTSLRTELAKSVIFDPRFQQNLSESALAQVAVKHRDEYGWFGPLAVPKSVSMSRGHLMPRVQHGRYEEREWYGPAFHEFASEGFLWLQHATMPLDPGSPLRVQQPNGLQPAGNAGQYHLPGGYLIEEDPGRGVVVWPRAYGTTMPAAQSGATHAIAGTAAGTFRTPPRLEVFAENGRLPLITKQMLSMILGTLEPGVAPQLKLHTDAPGTRFPAAPSADVPELPTVPMTALVPVRVSQSGSGVTHVWVGIPPDAGLAEKIRVAAGTVVVHAHGTNGAMAADPAELGEVIAASKATQVLLLVCEQTQAQQFADRHNIATWATKDAVFVNKVDGSVFLGHGEVDASGHLTIAHTNLSTLHKYVPGGSGPVVEPGASPLTPLIRAQAETRPNDWQKRRLNPLLQDMQRRAAQVQERRKAGGVDPEVKALLEEIGPDPLGLLDALPPRSFLKGHDQKLPANKVASFLKTLSMTGDRVDDAVLAERLKVENLAVGQTVSRPRSGPDMFSLGGETLPDTGETVEMPLVMASVWFGRALADQVAPRFQAAGGRCRGAVSRPGRLCGVHRHLAGAVRRGA